MRQTTERPRASRVAQYELLESFYAADTRRVQSRECDVGLAAGLSLAAELA